MESEQLKKIVLEAIDDLKGQDITELFVGDVTSVADWMIIVSGTSSRHVKSLANNVALEAKRAGSPAISIEGEDEGEWVLIDFADVIVHVMLPETRQFYDLESLWKVKPSGKDVTNVEQD